MKKKHFKVKIKRIIGILFLVLVLGSASITAFSGSFREIIINSNTKIIDWLNLKINKTVKILGFTVQHIQVEGIKFTSKLEVLNGLNINYGDNIFNVNAQEIVESLKKIGWIEHIIVQKKLPNIIDITIQEYQPYALWQYKNQVNVIAETGVIIPNVNPKNFLDLPLVVGEIANLQCKNLFSILLDYPGLKDMIVSAQYMYSRRWRLYFSTNVVVDLPEYNIGDAIHQVCEMHQQQKILDLDVEFIDMRVPNKLVFKGAKNIKKTKNMTHQGA
ncbi:MAG: FtsQ-type POTRA domain-containing protein [Candidatus Paracaedibacteraceae bacterium]|nr:FtsQ-type POTRA domain-containing protein [Candidatus Paracaedibacteraceae bacterium]